MEQPIIPSDFSFPLFMFSLHYLLICFVPSSLHLCTIFMEIYLCNHTANQMLLPSKLSLEVWVIPFRSFYWYAVRPIQFRDSGTQLWAFFDGRCMMDSDGWSFFEIEV